MSRESVEHPYVYIICTEDLRCKIGKSSRPIRRLDHIQSCCPDQLKLEHLIHPEHSWRDCNLEARLHRYFKSKGQHIHGEWFQLTEKDLEDIASRWSCCLSNLLETLRVERLDHQKKKEKFLEAQRLERDEWRIEGESRRRFMTDEEFAVWRRENIHRGK